VGHCKGGDKWGTVKVGECIGLVVELTANCSDSLLKF
jgi:hypothetical protein